MSNKKIYPVLSAVRHDGTLYSPDNPENNQIELIEKEAKPLLKLKVIGEPKAEPSGDFVEASADSAVKLSDTLNQLSGKSGENQSENGNGDQNAALSPEERQQAILNAFPSLNAQTDMTKAGEPKVKSVEALLGFDVSADEVKAAWAEVQAKAAAVTSAGDNRSQTGNE
ncbi:MAG: hypothetical protein N4A65_01010 [Cohaesibacter sp.]|jgi:hypothetical protein|nr:hypothetical protein [Cohaesibacter sp.]